MVGDYVGYIYKITNETNGKIYIGQTSRPLRMRWKEHQQAAYNEKKMSPCPLYKAMRKYGKESFVLAVVEECENEHLDEREQFWIKFYNSLITGNGYNLTHGGGNHWMRCTKEPEESRKKKSERQMGEGNSFYGKHHSREYRMAESVPVVSYTDDGVIIAYYASQIATNKYGFQQSHITDVVNHKVRHHGRTPDKKWLCWRLATPDESNVIRECFLSYGIDRLTVSEYEKYKEKIA